MRGNKIKYDNLIEKMIPVLWRAVGCVTWLTILFIFIILAKLGNFSCCQLFQSQPTTNEPTKTVLVEELP